MQTLLVASAKYDVVADKLGIDLTLLSKIEHGERNIQAHMIKGLAEIFELDFKELQIEILREKIKEDFGKEPFFIEAIQSLQRV